MTTHTHTEREIAEKMKSISTSFATKTRKEIESQLLVPAVVLIQPGGTKNVAARRRIRTDTRQHLFRHDYTEGHERRIHHAKKGTGGKSSSSSSDKGGSE